MFDVRIFIVDDIGSPDELVVGVARDVTAERIHASHLEVQATIDPLTCAYNRGQFEVLLTQAIQSARRRKTTGCLIFLDIDNFKSLNDSYGHDAGDRVLKQIVSVLHENLRASDVVGRLGGDEFGAILTDSDPTSGQVKARQLANALSEIKLSGQEEGIEVSIGLAAFPSQRERASDVIKRADTAMYRAKQTQGRNVEVWESE